MAMSLYKLDPLNPCSFDDSVGIADNINSVVDWSYAEGSTTSDRVSDGVNTIQGVSIDNVFVDVTITTKNPANVTGNSWSVGTCGTLVLNGVARACGNGVDVSPVTMTLTCDEAIITSIDFNVPHEGDSACNITFRCASSDGTDIFAVS